MSNPHVNPIPKGYEGITPHLFVSNAADAIEFYKKAFGAQEEYRHTLPDGKSIVHAVIKMSSQSNDCGLFTGHVRGQCWLT
jgi:PhnB protein